ncbi:MAG: FhaA domain-containing protein [Acidimicrobiia bacterium]
MGLADEFERRLERLVEGFFSKAFRSKIQPAEIGRRLLREMEANKRVSVGAVYVPNRFLIRLSPADYETLEGLLPTLKTEFQERLRAETKERSWRLPGRLDVQMEHDSSIKSGRFEVEPTHTVTEDGPSDSPASVLRLVDAETEATWKLESEEITIGRLDECDIVVVDPNASRRHARLKKRDENWWIEDLGATNGTLVNDTLVKERRLSPGDRIRIGSTEFEYGEG